MDLLQKFYKYFKRNMPPIDIEFIKITVKQDNAPLLDNWLECLVESGTCGGETIFTLEPYFNYIQLKLRRNY